MNAETVCHCVTASTGYKYYDNSKLHLLLTIGYTIIRKEEC